MKTLTPKRIHLTFILGLAAVAATMITARAADKTDAPNQAVVSPSPQRTPLVADGWKDPGVILTDIVWDNLPLFEVARYLKSESKNYFDVLFPNDLQYLTAPHPRVPRETVDARSILINLRLNKVTVTEVFNAMNIMFETENAPWSWQLLMNGNRPTAVLRILPELLPIGQPSPPPPEAPKKERMVIFVGDLMGDEKSGGMTMNQIQQTLAEVYLGAYAQTDSRKINQLLQIHTQAQLLVVTGTADEIRFVQSTLQALKQKVTLEQKRKAQPTAGQPKPKSEATRVW